MANGTNTGSCMCGSVAYRFQGAHIWCSYCHCDSCRKASGAALTVFVGFEDERIELLKGEPRIYKSSAGIERAFCQACGTSLWYRDARLPKTTYFSWEHWMSPSNSNRSITHGSQSDFDGLRSTIELSGIRRTRSHADQLGELCEGV